MATVTTAVPSLLYLDEQARARIQGTRFKVSQVARAVREGLEVRGIQEAYPGLSLAQIHAALSYYYEHQDAMEAQLQQEDRQVNEFVANHPNRVTREELRERLQYG